MQFKILAFLSILSILFFTACDSKNKEEKQEIKKENVIPKLKLLDTKGKEIAFDLNENNNNLTFPEYKGKIVLINFFATWCPPCKAEIPNLVKLQEKYKTDFQVISILLEKDKNNEQLQSFIENFKITYPVTNSPANYKLAKKLGGVKSIPTMFMLDKEGNIFQKYVGVVPIEMMEIDIKKVLQK